MPWQEIRPMDQKKEFVPEYRRFQLVALLDAGVTVMLGSDGVAPDRSYDIFRHMFQAMS